MKILIGVHHYPPAYSAGVEIVAQRQARWMAARGHSVEVVCVERIDAENHLSVQSEQLDGVTVHRLGLKLANLGEHLGLRYRDQMVHAWFTDYLARSRPDVFHSHSSYLLTASAMEAAIDAKVPVVATLHDYWYFCPRITLLRSNGNRCAGNVTPADCARCLLAERRRYRALDAAREKLGRFSPWVRVPLESQLVARTTDRWAYLDRVLRSADQVVTLAPFAQELLTARGFPENKVRLIPSGHDLSQWRRLPRSPRNGTLRIGYLGQVAPHKGIHLLVKAVRQLSSEGGPQLNIYGDLTRFPQYVANLRQLAAGDARIHFRGGYTNGTVEERLAEIDVLVVPSVWFETRPLVIMEAFAAGVPVIASRLPNMQYQVRHEIDGLLFDADHEGDLARQLQRLIDEPDLLDRLARGISTLRTIDEELTEIEDVYRSVTHARAAGGSPAEPLTRA